MSLYKRIVLIGGYLTFVTRVTSLRIFLHLSESLFLNCSGKWDVLDFGSFSCI